MSKKFLATLLLAVFPLVGCNTVSNSVPTGKDETAPVATTTSVDAAISVDATPQAETNSAFKCRINADCPVGNWCYVTDKEGYCKPNES